jgi:Ser/Thr protein kinase RdoA (MazF antagonist)
VPPFTRTFDLLHPALALQALEGAFGMQLDGTVTEYASYVNRVYGVRDDAGIEYVAKFYRPGRWDRAAIVAEHLYVADCVAAELPVVAPMASAGGETLLDLDIEESGQSERFLFSCYPKRSGRNFDAEHDDDWLRIGRLIGRLHAVSDQRSAPERLICKPDASTAAFVLELREAEVVADAAKDEFFELADRCVAQISPLFETLKTIRVHGDCHRGNVLDRQAEGLLLIDFDDMMIGPAVQDLWLMLPGRLADSRREIELLIEGYEQFHEFDRSSLNLVEPLRLMRMIYYMAWSARQRADHHFQVAYPHWGSPAFWIQEIQDLETQLALAVA